MPESDTDLPLWKELKQGNDAALDALMDRHSEGLFRFIYRYVLSEEDAQDLVQATFVKAYFKRHQFKPRAKISAWLYRIALNLCRDHSRSRSAKERRVTESLDLPREEIAGKIGTASDHATEREDILLLKEAIRSLPNDLRVALVLAVLEETPQEECAQILGISRKAVETRVYRARKLLVQRLDARG